MKEPLLTPPTVVLFPDKFLWGEIVETTTDGIPPGSNAHSSRSLADGTFKKRGVLVGSINDTVQRNLFVARN